MSMDFAYLKSHIPVLPEIQQILLAVGWALLIGNLVFQALKSMSTGLGFEGEDPKLLFTRTFVFAFLLLASLQICEIGLNMTPVSYTHLSIHRLSATGLHQRGWHETVRRQYRDLEDPLPGYQYEGLGR